MTVLSVNLNKIALLRNARGEGKPDLAAAARTCVAAGCAGITVHPRPDQRHVRPADVAELAVLTRELGVEFNIEGNPFAPAQGSYPGFIALVEQARPTQVTLVPDADAQLTSDHGFAFPYDAARLAPLVRELAPLGCRVSVFVDAGLRAFDGLHALGIRRVEIYTGPYARAWAAGNGDAALAECAACAEAAMAAGLAVNAGHDLDQTNLGPLRAAVPQLAEVSIGHALIGEALYAGLDATVRAYVDLLKQDGRRGRRP